LFLAITNYWVGKRHFPVPYSWHIPAVIGWVAICFLLFEPMTTMGWNLWLLKILVIAGFFAGAGLLTLNYKKL
jgi:hypothetical protein